MLEALERLEESIKAAGPIPEQVRWDLDALRREIERSEAGIKEMARRNTEVLPWSNP